VILSSIIISYCLLFIIINNNLLPHPPDILMDAMVWAPIVSRCVYHDVPLSKFELLTKKYIYSGTSGGCSAAFFTPDQTFKQVACQVNNVRAANLTIFPKKRELLDI
jgi:hypothetical protein